MVTRFSFRACVVLLAVGAAGCGGSTEAPRGVSEANPLDEEEDALIYDLNRAREDAGIAAPVIVCKSLNVSASKHADDMRDKGYLDDDGKDGSDVRSRGCEAGYLAGCEEATAMAELVASGINGGKATLAQWTTDASSNAILTNKDLVVVGVGRSLDLEGPKWALDFGSVDEDSCR
jgi:uncharacterized protein YkwD